MQSALYGEGGFYTTVAVPARHFRTAAHASSLWAHAVLDLAGRVDATLGSPAQFTMVDVGAGGGELMTALAGLAPPRWRLVAVDVADRPPDLPGRVEWTARPPADVVGVVVAAELLDVVPVDVAMLTPAGPRLIRVDAGGAESVTSPPLPARDLDWLDRWWPLQDIGDRAEVGWPRDRLWRSIAATVRAGLAIAIDYEALPERDVTGTLTGFRDGRQVLPVPDGSCDLTAHVRFASLTEPHDVVLSQREALRRLGLTAGRPAYDGDPSAYLSSLSRAGEAAELLDPGGLGGFTWLLHPVGIALPLR
jgi:SAM-dependent MidA family methyltransferase